MRVWKINADSGRVGYRLADPGEMEQWPARLVEISPAEWDVVVVMGKPTTFPIVHHPTTVATWYWVNDTLVDSLT